MVKLGDRVRVKDRVWGMGGYGTVGTLENGEWVGTPDPDDGSWPVTLDGGKVTRLFEDEVYVVRELAPLADSERTRA